MKIAVGPVFVHMLDPGDRIVAHMRSGKGFEPRSLDLWAQMCGGGGTVVDVGAYTGLFAIAAAKMGCNVVAFEPMPLNAARLNENAKRNGVRARIRILEMAAGDQDFVKVRIGFSPNVEGLTSGASLLRKSGNSHEVAMMTVDFLRMPQVSAIKIDVERAEAAVLRGARRTIAACRPEILVEVLDEQRKQEVREALPSYRIADEIDRRNWYMVPGDGDVAR